MRYIAPCLLLWNVLVSYLADAGEPVMETTRHIKMSIIQGNTIILPCMINFKDVDDSDRRKYSVIWTGKDGRVLTINERVQGNHRKFELSHPYPNEWNLKGIRVRNTDSGVYKCQVNSDPVQTKTVVLVVHVPPRIYSSESVEVKETERLVIYCNVTGDPTPSVSWYKDKEELAGFSGEMLVIKKAARNNSGLYRCEAENGIDPSDSEDITVDVLYAPTVQLSTKQIFQYRYKSIVLDCNVIANPAETVTWYKNGQIISSNWKYNLEDYEQSDGSRTHSLDIGYLERLDFGDYICMATNKVSSASQVVTVTEITTSTVISNSESTTIKPDNNQDKTSPTVTSNTDGKDKTTPSKISSTTDSNLYIPDSSPKNGELVVVPDNSSDGLAFRHTLLLVSLMMSSASVR